MLVSQQLLNTRVNVYDNNKKVQQQKQEVLCSKGAVRGLGTLPLFVFYGLLEVISAVSVLYVVRGCSRI